MTGQFPGRPDVEDLTRARGFALSVAEHVSASHSGLLPEGRPDALKPGWGFYESMALAISDRLLRFVMPEPKPDRVKCDQCRWCVDECPMDNITLESRPVLGERCIRCYRCLTGCPQEAFEVNWRFVDPFLMLLYNAKLMRWFGDLKPGEQVY
jgi:ferredoxin